MEEQVKPVKKKRFYKKWYFWTHILLVLMWFSALGSNTETQTASESRKEVKTVTAEPKEDTVSKDEFDKVKSENEQLNSQVSDLESKNSENEKTIATLNEEKSRLQTDLDGAQAQADEATKKEEADKAAKSQVKTVTLKTGTFTVGEDIAPGRYVVTTKADSGNYVVMEGELPVVNEVMGSAFGVTEVTSDLTEGQQVQIMGMPSLTFTPK